MSIWAEQVVNADIDRHCFSPLDSMPVYGQQIGLRIDEMGSPLQDKIPFSNGLSHALKINMLKVAKTAVGDFGAVR